MSGYQLSGHFKDGIFKKCGFHFRVSRCCKYVTCETFLLLRESPKWGPQEKPPQCIFEAVLGGFTEGGFTAGRII